MVEKLHDVRALRVVARLGADDDAIELMSKLVTLLADRQVGKKIVAR